MASQASKRNELIREFLFKNKIGSSSGIHSFILSRDEDISLVTVKRALSLLEKEGVIAEQGTGPATAYELTVQGRITAPIDARTYCAIEPDRRYGNERYNFELFSGVSDEIFSPAELDILQNATKVYQSRRTSLSQTLHKKELERFIVELSWKSSKIEGNTYSLLDTERLIEKGIEAPGKSKEEALMVLNHKKAFSYIYEHADEFKTLTKTNLSAVHRLLVEDLNVAFNFRKKPVGVTGSKYRPLDNEYQIAEAVGDLGSAVTRLKSGYAKVLVALLGISYIQPFEDGNKRTSRLMGNAVLLAYGFAPLSYRSVDEESYREAMLVFYELNSLIPFKKIFIEQYRFAAENYAL